MTNVKKIIAASLAIVMGAILPTNTALASDFPQQFSKSNSSLSTINYKSSGINIDSIKNDISSGKITLNTDANNLDWANIEVIEQEGKIASVIPILNDGDSWSNLAIYFSSDRTIESYIESHFTTLNTSSGHVKIYSNGVAITDSVFTNDDLKQNSTSFRGIPDAVNELQKCLSEAGIPAWVVAGASAACSLGGGWAGITACYTAAIVGGGTVGYCVGKAGQKL